jgi:signal transduction histidine kinase
VTPDVVVGIVSAAAPRAAVIAATEAAGASAEICTETTVLGKAGVVDAIVFDLGADASRFLVCASALGGDPRTRWLPRIIIVDGATPVEQIAAFGPSCVVALASPPEAVAAAITDVVEHVRARQNFDRQLHAEIEELRATEKRLVALQQEGATLSHDARVLFGVIMGFASNLRDGIAGPVSEMQRNHAKNIIEASTGASSLVDRHVTALRAALRKNQRAAARALGSRLAARRRQHELGELIRPIVGLFEGIAAAKGIRLSVVVERPVPSWCDSMQIKQALVNLLTNALKFTPAGGAVEVQARFGPPASSRGGNTDRRDVELVVSDTGPGIPVEERERIFERGVRLERDLLSTGTGIGLAVVRDVVELHGGTVKIEDAPGGGASFVMTFPADLRTRSGERLVSVPPAVAPVRALLEGAKPVDVE